VDAPFVVKFPDQDLASFDHFIDGCSAAGRLAHLFKGGSRSLGRFAGRDIGYDPLRLSEDAVVENERLQATFEDPIPKILNFLAFRIQGAKDKNRSFFFSREKPSPLNRKSPSSLVLGKENGGLLPPFPIIFYHRRPEEAMRKGASPAFTSEKK